MKSVNKNAKLTGITTLDMITEMNTKYFGFAHSVIAYYIGKRRKEHEVVSQCEKLAEMITGIIADAAGTEIISDRTCGLASAIQAAVREVVKETESEDTQRRVQYDEFGERTSPYDLSRKRGMT